MFADYKKIIIKILLLYLGTSIAFLSVFFYFLEKKERQNIILTQSEDAREITLGIYQILRKNDLESALNIIKSQSNNIAIYDKNKHLIFSNLSKLPNEREFRDGIFYIDDKIALNYESMFRKRRAGRMPYKIFVLMDKIDSDILFMRLQLLGAFIAICALFGIVAYNLILLFLKPLNNHLKKLDSFIKDTTHEINTPLSVILMSLESMQLNQAQNIKKANRIRLASLQLSNIYNALIAYNFPSKTTMEILRFDVILSERVEYFAPFFKNKNIELKKQLRECFIIADRAKIILMLDNLINNAIKYNKKGGFIALATESGRFSIKNSGSEIKKEHKAMIFERYTRFNQDSGGFGIGLNIVLQICDEFGIDIKIESSKNENEFILTWQES